MHADRSLYNYRRFTKPETPTSSTHEPEWLAPYSVITGIVGNAPAPTEGEEIFQALAKAERPLRLKTQEREYQEDSGNHALRLINLGVRQLQNGNFPAAFRSLMDAIDLDGTLAPAHNNLGLMYLEIGDMGRAVQHFTQAISSQKAIDVAYGNRGLAFLEMGRFTESCQDLSTALEMDPADPMHHNNMGLLCLELNSPDTALVCFDRAVELSVRLRVEAPVYYNNRGLAHELLGDTSHADRDFLMAARLAEQQLDTGLDPA